jgi:hypothetical protein
MQTYWKYKEEKRQLKIKCVKIDQFIVGWNVPGALPLRDSDSRFRHLYLTKMSESNIDIAGEQGQLATYGTVLY